MSRSCFRCPSSAPIAWTLSLGLASLIASGCQNSVNGGGPDVDFLTDQHTTSKPESGSLFPGDLGNKWSLSATMRGSVVQMDVRVAGNRKVGPNLGRLFQTRLQDRVIQQEVYRFDESGVSRLAGGAHAEIVFSPPMPLLRYPIQNGDAYYWQGKITSSALRATGKMLCEVSGPEPIRIAAGNFNAYRLDVVTRVTNGGKVSHTPSTIWFAKNVGMVKQIVTEGSNSVFLELSSHSLK